MDKTFYTIRNFVTDKEHVVDITYIRPFYFYPNYVTTLDVEVKDTDETVVDAILQHDFLDPTDKKWLVRWVIHHSKIFKTLSHLTLTLILSLLRNE